MERMMNSVRTFLLEWSSRHPGLEDMFCTLDEEHFGNEWLIREEDE